MDSSFSLTARSAWKEDSESERRGGDLSSSTFVRAHSRQLGFEQRIALEEACASYELNNIENEKKTGQH